MCQWCDKNAAKAPPSNIQTIGITEFLPQSEYDKDASSPIGPLTQGIYHVDPSNALAHRDSLIGRKSVHMCRADTVDINLN